VGITFDTIVGALGIGLALQRGVADYRRKGSITWGWALVALVFLAIALTPAV
jgi:O-antigen/teichoic acid export membrane protein